MPRKQKKYHYIYKTTCQVTGKFYIGMHSTDDLEDGYLGSGKILGYSLAKHGKENHKKEILEFLPDRVALKAREAEVVNEELLANPLCINLKYGGEGGWDHISPEIRKVNAIANSGFCNQYKLSSESRQRIADGSSKGGKITGQKIGKKYVHLAIAAAALPNACEKRRQTMKERGHMQGDKNSQFGTCWVTNGVKPIKIKKEELNEYLQRGYSVGRKVLTSIMEDEA